MAWKLQIIRCKPNPKGKDKNDSIPIASKLLGEWVDLKNVGDAPVSLTIPHLSNTKFGTRCEIKERYSIYWNGANGTLAPGEILRVHTGRQSDYHSISIEDKTGANHHAFAESGSFVLNNDCGDSLSILWSNSQTGSPVVEDAAYYDPKPSEGKILNRIGNKLV